MGQFSPDENSIAWPGQATSRFFGRYQSGNDQQLETSGQRETENGIEIYIALLSRLLARDPLSLDSWPRTGASARLILRRKVFAVLPWLKDFLHAVQQIGAEALAGGVLGMGQRCGPQVKPVNLSEVPKQVVRLFVNASRNQFWGYNFESFKHVLGESTEEWPLCWLCQRDAGETKSGLGFRISVDIAPQRQRRVAPSLSHLFRQRVGCCRRTRPRSATRDGKCGCKNQKPETRVEASSDEDESEEVELTLTLPLAARVAELKAFLAERPESKSRERAVELLVSAHAALGDERLKKGDSAGGIEELMLAISEAPVNSSERLFSGVISQIPSNLYLRGERAAATNAAKDIEAKFGADPKRLVAISGFYLGTAG